MKLHFGKMNYLSSGKGETTTAVGLMDAGS